MKKIIATLLCLIMLLSLLSGCGSSDKRSVEAEKFISEQLDVFKSATAENIETILGGDGSGAIFSGMDPAFFVMLYQNLEYTILDSIQEGDTASVKLEISNLDCGAVMVDYISKLLQASADYDYADTSDSNDLSSYDEELSKIASEVVADIVENGEYKTLTNIVNVSLTKTGGVWKIDDSDAMSAAILPGLNSVVDGDVY